MSSSAPISSIVYTRYASALIDLAEQEKAIDKIKKDLIALEGMIQDSADLSEMIASPLISVEKQSGVIQEIVKKAKLNKLTANFLGVLVQNRRLAALPGIISVFNKIIAERSGVVEVRLETAVKLTAAQAKEFQKKIEKALGATVSIEEKVTPEIMGGVIVTIGSYMIDDSVRRKLDRLGVALKSNANENTVQNLKEVV
ncbi:MAG: ATP synthase F1 subunit delta [Alcanivorax sp.]